MTRLFKAGQTYLSPDTYLIIDRLQNSLALTKFRAYFVNITHYFSASLIPMLLNLAINPLVSLAMDPKDFAIVGYFTSYSSLISPIIVFYLLHYYNKRYFELDEDGRLHLKSVLFKALIFFSFAMSLICLLVLIVYISLFSAKSFTLFPYLYMVVLSIPFSGIYLLELAELKMKRESKVYMNYSLYKGTVAVACTLIFVVLIRWGAFGKLLGPILIDVTMFFYILNKNKSLFKIKTTLNELYSILKFCAPLVIGAALGYFSIGYDKNVLEHLGKVTEFGYYCVGASIAGYLSVFTTSISSTFQPDLYEAIISNNRKKMIKVSLLRWGLTLIVVVSFIAVCPILIRILTAGRYIASTHYARIFALLPLTNCIYYIINDYSIARNRPYFYTITTVLGSIITIVLMPLSVKLLEFEGAAYMMVCNFIVLSAINISLFKMEKYYNVLKKKLL